MWGNCWRNRGSRMGNGCGYLSHCCSTSSPTRTRSIPTLRSWNFPTVEEVEFRGFAPLFRFLVPSPTFAPVSCCVSFPRFLPSVGTLGPL